MVLKKQERKKIIKEILDKLKEKGLFNFNYKTKEEFINKARKIIKEKKNNSLIDFILNDLSYRSRGYSKGFFEGEFFTKDEFFNNKDVKQILKTNNYLSEEKLRQLNLLSDKEKKKTNKQIDNNNKMGLDDWFKYFKEIEPNIELGNIVYLFQGLHYKEIKYNGEPVLKVFNTDDFSLCFWCSDEKIKHKIFGSEFQNDQKKFGVNKNMKYQKIPTSPSIVEGQKFIMNFKTLIQYLKENEKKIKSSLPQTFSEKFKSMIGLFSPNIDEPPIEVNPERDFNATISPIYARLEYIRKGTCPMCNTSYSFTFDDFEMSKIVRFRCSGCWQKLYFYYEGEKRE